MTRPPPFWNFSENSSDLVALPVLKRANFLDIKTTDFLLQSRSGSQESLSDSFYIERTCKEHYDVLPCSATMAWSPGKPKLFLECPVQRLAKTTMTYFLCNHGLSGWLILFLVH